MTKINKEERILINMKLCHHKNELIRNQKEKREKKAANNAAKNDENPGTSKPDQTDFPWEQKQQWPQRNRGRGKGRGKDSLIV